MPRHVIFFIFCVYIHIYTYECAYPSCNPSVHHLKKLLKEKLKFKDSLGFLFPKEKESHLTFFKR